MYLGVSFRDINKSFLLIKKKKKKIDSNVVKWWVIMKCIKVSMKFIPSKINEDLVYFFFLVTIMIICCTSDFNRYVNSYEEPSPDYCPKSYFDQFQLQALRENTNLGVDNLKPNFEGKIKEVEKDQVL